MSKTFIQYLNCTVNTCNSAWSLIKTVTCNT